MTVTVTTDTTCQNLYNLQTNDKKHQSTRKNGGDPSGLPSHTITIGTDNESAKKTAKCKRCLIS